ncbi:MAG: protease modulator HflK, partial [Halioglobus sp.]|nr:protease modulator HflK [Halioglobus sp.]
MSWNEPGGGSNKPNDPWGGGGNQGPPDLDEALKKLQGRLRGLFGGGGTAAGGGGGSPGISGTALGVIVIVALLIWAALGFYQVDQQERGVVLRFGKYYEVVDPGLHWNPPLIDQVSKLNITKVRSASFREIMLTQDENIVEVKLSVQYVITDPVAFALKVR